LAKLQLGRKWLAFDNSHQYLQASIFRFIGIETDNNIYDVVRQLENPQADLKIDKLSNSQLRLFDKPENP